MKAFAVAAIAALLSFPALAQQGATPEQMCAELGQAIHAAALGASDVRVNYGDFSDARATAKALAADELNILRNAEAYDVVSDMVDGMVVELYQMPQSRFSGGTHSDVPWQVAEQARSMAVSGCMEGFRRS